MDNSAKHDKPTDIKFSLRTFSNREIEELLENSPNFREIKPARTKKFLAAMLGGWWDWSTGETLGFDTKGRLVNGQHRLAAAKQYQERTGKKAWFWCANNIARGSEQYMDQGDSRKLGDYLRNASVKNYNVVATIVIGLVRYNNLPEASKKTLSGLAGTVSEGGHSEGWVAPSVAQMIDFYKRNSAAVDEWAAIGTKLNAARVAKYGLLARLGYALALKNDLNAKLFFSYLVDGKGMKDGDPCAVLRERLIGVRLRKERTTPTAVLAIAVKAWVAWLTGKPIQKLRWVGVGPSAEPFPSHIVNEEDAA